jgi:hypothetical protein
VSENARFPNPLQNRLQSWRFESSIFPNHDPLMILTRRQTLKSLAALATI